MMPRSTPGLLASALLVAAADTLAAQPAATKKPPNEATWKKLAPYTQCINTVSQRVLASRTSYGEWVDFKKGPSPRNKFATWGIDAIGPTAECTEGLARGATMTPRLAELEAAAGVYARALDEIAPLVNEAHEYYRQGDFKDDKMAKGAALHPRLMAAWESFASANSGLHQQLAAIHQRLEDEELAWLEKSGQRLAYLRGRTMRLARELADAVKTPKELDLAVFQPRLDAYQAGLRELEASLASQKVDGVLAYLYPAFVERGKNYLASAKELARQKGKNDILKGEFAERRRGHPAQVIGAYNELVDQSNQLRR
jgi:hypothetical protein